MQTGLMKPSKKQSIYGKGQYFTTLGPRTGGPKGDRLRYEIYNESSLAHDSSHTEYYVRIERAKLQPLKSFSGTQILLLESNKTLDLSAVNAEYYRREVQPGEKRRIHTSAEILRDEL